MRAGAATGSAASAIPVDPTTLDRKLIFISGVFPVFLLFNSEIQSVDAGG